MDCQVTTLLVCFLLSITLFSVDGGIPQRQRCPDGFHEHGYNCYWFSTMTAKFASARSICEHIGSRLATISSQSEDDFIVSFAHQTGKAGFYFLGGSDIALEGLWKWEGRQPMGYTNWGPGQPDDHGSGEDCLGIWATSNYQWNDESCNNMFNFICEITRVD